MQLFASLPDVNKNVLGEGACMCAGPALFFAMTMDSGRGRVALLGR